MKRDARIKAMQILYTCDFQGLEIKDALEMEEEIDELAVTLAEFCFANLSKVDELISSTLERYTIDRLNLVDKAIIRLAVSEMLNGKEPRQVIINEALEITKLFTDIGDYKAVGFNNRLLDNINKKLKVE